MSLRPVRTPHNHLSSSHGSAMRYAIFWYFTQRSMVTPFRRFGTTYLSHLQGSSSPKTTCPLKMEPMCCPETSARKYNSTLRKIPKERRCHLYRGGSLKSRQHQAYHAITNSSASETGNFCRAVVVTLHPNSQVIAQQPTLGTSVTICSHKYARLFVLTTNYSRRFCSPSSGHCTCPAPAALNLTIKPVIL
jgi:hypothetical protein